MVKIKTGDKVVILAGKSKGMTGTVTRVLRKVGRVIVEGANKVKKHVRPNPQLQQPGGIVEQEAPLHISNVALVNPATNKADRVGIKEVDGKKRRYFKSNGELVDVE